MDKRLGGEGGLGLPRRGDSCLQPGRGFLFYVFIFKDFIYSFLERGEGREKERERNINVWLSLECPLLGTRPTTQAFALTGNQKSDTLVARLALNPLSHTSQGYTSFFYLSIFLEYFFSNLHLQSV